MLWRCCLVFPLFLFFMPRLQYWRSHTYSCLEIALTRASHSLGGGTWCQFSRKKPIFLLIKLVCNCFSGLTSLVCAVVMCFCRWRRRPRQRAHGKPSSAACLQPCRSKSAKVRRLLGDYNLDFIGFSSVAFARRPDAAANAGCGWCSPACVKALSSVTLPRQAPGAFGLMPDTGNSYVIIFWDPSFCVCMCSSNRSFVYSRVC